MGIGLVRRTALLPEFDRRCVPAYAVLAVMSLIGLLSMLLRGFTLSPSLFSGFPLIALWIYSAGLLRRVGFLKVATWLEANALVYGQTLPAFLILAPGASLAMPIADARLAEWDHALGLDWVGTVYRLHGYLEPLWIAYSSFHWQPALVIAGLAAIAPDRCWQYTVAGIISLLAVSVIFPLMPAYGAFNFYGIEPSGYPPFSYESAPWSWIDPLNRLRGGYRTLDSSVMGALVAFPSYHAVVGVLSAWAAWPYRYVRVPALILNAGLIVSALIFGAHYFVDLLAGMALGVFSLACASNMHVFGWDKSAS